MINHHRPPTPCENKWGYLSRCGIFSGFEALIKPKSGPSAASCHTQRCLEGGGWGNYEWGAGTAHKGLLLGSGTSYSKKKKKDHRPHMRQWESTWGTYYQPPRDQRGEGFLKGGVVQCWWIPLGLHAREFVIMKHMVHSMLISKG